MNRPEPPKTHDPYKRESYEEYNRYFNEAEKYIDYLESKVNLPNLSDRSTKRVFGNQWIYDLSNQESIPMYEVKNGVWVKTPEYIQILKVGDQKENEGLPHDGY